jgi:hypothetical protein
MVQQLQNDGGGADTAEPFYLKTIHGLKNVNALAVGQEIEFNRRLTIVFGEKASGQDRIRPCSQADRSSSVN